MRCIPLPKGTVSYLVFGPIILCICITASNNSSDRKIFRIVYRQRVYKLCVIDLPNGSHLLTGLRGDVVKVQVTLRRDDDGNWIAGHDKKGYRLVPRTIPMTDERISEPKNYVVKALGPKVTSMRTEPEEQHSDK